MKPTLLRPWYRSISAQTRARTAASSSSCSSKSKEKLPARAARLDVGGCLAGVGSSMHGAGLYRLLEAAQALYARKHGMP